MKDDTIAVPVALDENNTIHETTQYIHIGNILYENSVCVSVFYLSSSFHLYCLHMPTDGRSG